MKENWARIMTTRDLLCGLKPNNINNKILVEWYDPQNVAIQFGLLQHISLSYESTVLRATQNINEVELDKVAGLSLKKVQDFSMATYPNQQGESNAFPQLVAIYQDRF